MMGLEQLLESKLLSTSAVSAAGCAVVAAVAAGSETVGALRECECVCGGERGGGVGALAHEGQGGVWDARGCLLGGGVPNSGLERRRIWAVRRHAQMQTCACT